MTNNITNGSTFTLNDGSVAIVENYVNANNIEVVFDTGNRAIVRAQHLRNGGVKNPLAKTVYGVGYVGIGPHRVSLNSKKNAAYQCWYDMLERCYSEKLLRMRPTYKGCVVCDEWHNFQTFADFYHNDPYRQDGWELDKDLIVPGNKEYGPNVCAFVPSHLNSILSDHRGARGNLPQGVNIKGNNYQAKISKDGVRVNIGHYPTQELAYAVYESEKLKYLKEVANRYIGKVDQRVIDSLIKRTYI